MSVRILRPGQTPVRVDRHIDGQVRLTVGRDGVLLTHPQAIQIARGLLEGAGIRLEKGIHDA